MFNACGESYESLLPYAVTIDFDGVPVHTLNIEGLLKTKQTSRDKGKLDRIILERTLQSQSGTQSHRYIFLRYCPPTSNSAFVICPSEQTRTASISTSNTFLFSITAC